MKRNVFIIIVLFVFNIEAKDFNKNIEDSASFFSDVIELQEVIVESKKYPLLHLLAYVREYSTLTTYNDTIFLFREKIVDFMVPQNNKVSFKGWETPRILSSKSYYRFTNQLGLDSVSDECMYHFSWSDWVGLPPRVTIPLKMRENDICTDTLHGKYSPVEIWNRANDKINVNINLLADTVGHKWVPSVRSFLESGINFDQFTISYNYANIIGEEVSARDLESYSYSIDSTGRGRYMFRFNRNDEPYYVCTNAEVYFIDKEYLTIKEAKKWDKHNFDLEEIGIFQSSDAPPLSSDIMDLIARIDNIDKNEIRTKLKPDKRIRKSTDIPNKNLRQKALSFIRKILRI